MIRKKYPSKPALSFFSLLYLKIFFFEMGMAKNSTSIIPVNVGVVLDLDNDLDGKCRGCAASRRIFHFLESRMCVWYLGMTNVGRQENIVFCWKEMEWESPPNILVTRNPNWSQRLGTGTGCVKGRY